MSLQENLAPAILVEVTRGDMVESRHRGLIAAVTPDGTLIASLGDVTTRTYFRSAAKPFQAIPIITTGAADRFSLTPAEIAVINGSHSGEAIHIEAVRTILTKIGLDESALQCGAHLPFDEISARSLRATNIEPTVLHNNCSGKHAGMLALARHLGEPIENYLDPTHPIQQLICNTLARFSTAAPDKIATAIDGCSAPVFGLALAEMARSYAQLVAPEATNLDRDLHTAAMRVVAAMSNYPEMVGGTKGRLDTDLMRATDGALISKVGAEGLQLIGIKPCVRYPLGLGLAIKIEDGDTRRARDPVVIETLRQLGVLNEKQLASLARYARATIYNYRRLEVGEVRPHFNLW